MLPVDPELVDAALSDGEAFGTVGPGGVQRLRTLYRSVGDGEVLADRLARPPGETTWYQAFRQQPIGPADLILTEETEQVQFYVGRHDFLVRGQDYRRYVYRAADALRAIYTNAMLLHNDGDFERLVERPNAGRRVWLLGTDAGLPAAMGHLDPHLWPSLVRSADRVISLGDGWVLVEGALPRRRKAP